MGFISDIKAHVNECDSKRLDLQQPDFAHRRELPLTQPAKEERAGFPNFVIAFTNNNAQCNGFFKTTTDEDLGEDFGLV